jgi:hypothetical protein
MMCGCTIVPFKGAILGWEAVALYLTGVAEVRIVFETPGGLPKVRAGLLTLGKMVFKAGSRLEFSKQLRFLDPRRFFAFQE